MSDTIIAENLIIASTISANFIYHIKLADNSTKETAEASFETEAVCYTIPTEV